MGVIVTQAQATATHAGLGAAQSAAGAHAASTAAWVSALPKLTSHLVVSAANVNTVVLTASLGACASMATVGAGQSAQVTGALVMRSALVGAAVQTVAGVGSLGAPASSLTVLSININTAHVTARLVPLRVSATLEQVSSARAVSGLPLATRAGTAASQAVRAVSRLPLLYSFVSLPTQNTGRITATLGALASAIIVQPPPSGYAPDGQYYVAIAARPFYATLATRSFYAATVARPFYIMSNPDMSPNFSTLDPRETQVLTFDASNDLADGETLTSINEVTVTAQFGTGATLPALTGQIINGMPVTVEVNGKSVTIATGCAVQVVASGGVSGCGYLISITCATSNTDKVLTLKGILPVSAN